MNTELADVDTGSLESSGPSLRGQIESAVAVHSTTSPDIESKVSGALEHRDREIRTRDRERNPGARQWEGEASDKRRAAIRDAFAQEKAKTAQQATAPRTEQLPSGQVITSPGAPHHFDSVAKSQWDSIPHETKAAIQRAEAGFARHHQEIEAALAPSRETFRQHGLSGSQAVAKLVEWERSFANPATRVQAFQALAHQYGIQIGGNGPGPDQHYVDPQESQRVQSTLQQFSRGRPHYEAVRGTMGLLIHRHEGSGRYLLANGGVDLDRAYQDACKFDGVGNEPRQAPRPPAPSNQGRRGLSVGDSIRAAARTVRRA